MDFHPNHEGCCQLRRSGSLPPGFKVSDCGCPTHATQKLPITSVVKAAPVLPSVLAESDHTTVMVRNIPTRIDQTTFLGILLDHNYLEQVSFFYLPMDLRSGKSLGYCFIDFMTAFQAQAFCRAFSGIQLRPTSPKTLVISWARLQGVEENAKLFSTSAALHALDRTLQPLIRVGMNLIPLSLRVVSDPSFTLSQSECTENSKCCRKSPTSSTSPSGSPSSHACLSLDCTAPCVPGEDCNHAKPDPKVAALAVELVGSAVGGLLASPCPDSCHCNEGFEDCPKPGLKSFISGLLFS